ncbi:MAG: hypothetical protein ABID54_12880 [Pseudomonadota bacterium]
MIPKLIVFSYKQEIREAMLKLARGLKLTLLPVNRWTELTALLSRDQRSLVFVDSNVQRRLGLRIYKDIHSLSPQSRVVLINSPPHTQNLVKQAMGAGVYGCLSWPLKKWEASTLIDYLLRDMDD